ncbi:MAG: hypothetical protein ABFS45_16600, partial [Pseudomonadota bacterium]
MNEARREESKFVKLLSCVLLCRQDPVVPSQQRLPALTARTNLIRQPLMNLPRYLSPTSFHCYSR